MCVVSGPAVSIISSYLEKWRGFGEGNALHLLDGSQEGGT